MDYIKLQNGLKVSEYLELISSIGWKSLTEEQVKIAIDKSMYVVKAVVNNKTVAMGRLVGDFGCHGMLTDIVVHPDFQGKGIGTKIVLNIKNYLNDYVKKGEKFIIELCPTSGKRNFYIKCGFKYKPENMDGMYLWIEK
jgi:GNAT superfamily N-acetyltransferase